MNKNDLPYLNYWKKKEIQSKGTVFPVIKYFVDTEVSPSTNLIGKKLSQGQSVLDYGAGDKKLKNQILKDYKGEYFSQDISDEYEYDYKSIDDINRSFDGIAFIDVLEHLPLEEGLFLVHQLLEKLNSGGTLVIQTPNGKCIRNHLGSDMTHKQLFNLADLHSYYSAQNYNVEGFRVHFTKSSNNLLDKIYDLFGRFIVTRLLGVDYADNILVFITKK